MNNSRNGKANRHPLFRILICFVSLLTIAAPRSVHADASSTRIPQDIGIEQHLGAQLPLDESVVDESGRSIPLAAVFRERPVILLFVYYRCPMLCGLELQGLVRSLRTLEWTAGQEFDVVCISIDPDETPSLAAAKKQSILSQYGREGSERGWHFLTAPQSTIERLTAAAGFQYAAIPGKEEYAHAAGLFISTPKGKVARTFFGLEYAPRDIRLSLIEASREKLGSIVDQVQLYCYLYDPTTGKYGLAILRIIRVAGLLTAGSIAMGIVMMLRRERQEKPSPPVESDR